ncbi:MAG: hypothetical protein AAF702_42565 [Chloroflexota bacterium]
MAKSNPKLIEALRETADRLHSGARYEWGHMGRCNCGHLVQTITELSDTEIVACVGNQLDEWTEFATDYCEGTGQNVEGLFATLHQVGFGYQDVIHLENLSDKNVLRHLGNGTPRYLHRNNVADVTLYMETLAELLEEEHA